jgi:hypothetical protein
MPRQVSPASTSLIPMTTFITSTRPSFSHTRTSNTGSIRSIPLYYGTLMFAQAVQNQAGLLPITLTTNNNFTTNNSCNINAWAAVDSSKRIRRLLLNKDAGDGNATITYLIAPSYQARQGLTIGCFCDGQPVGQTFDNTPDRTLPGTPVGKRLYQTRASARCLSRKSVRHLLRFNRRRTSGNVWRDRSRRAAATLRGTLALL